MHVGHTTMIINMITIGVQKTKKALTSTNNMTADRLWPYRRCFWARVLPVFFRWRGTWNWLLDVGCSLREVWPVWRPDALDDPWQETSNTTRKLLTTGLCGDVEGAFMVFRWLHFWSNSPLMLLIDCSPFSGMFTSLLFKNFLPLVSMVLVVSATARLESFIRFDTLRIDRNKLTQRTM